MEVPPNTYRQRVLNHLRKNRPNEVARLRSQDTLTERVDELATQIADWVNSQQSVEDLSHLPVEERITKAEGQRLMLESDALREILPIDEETERQIGPSGAYEDLARGKS